MRYMYMYVYVYLLLQVLSKREAPLINGAGGGGGARCFVKDRGES